MADNIKYRFIQNIGDFFPSGYFGEDFIDKVQKIMDYSADQVNDICSKYVQFRRKYSEYKNRIVSQTLRPKDSIRYTHDFHTELLKLLGYDISSPYSEQYILDESQKELIPVRHILRQGNNIQLLIMEMRHLIKTDDQEPAGLFEQQYDDDSKNNKVSRFTASHWSDVYTLPEEYKISPAVVNKAIGKIFLMPDNRRPSYILMLAGNTVFLFDKEKWNRGSYLSFTLDDLFSQASISAFRKYYALFHMLVCRDTLSPMGESVKMDSLVEDSYKNAYSVTKDLKEGVVNAVETLANEALWFWQHLPEDSKIKNPLDTIDYTDDDFEAEVKDDCLTIVYRLLFLFYAESRTELEILPVSDEVYERGYSLEMLRDLEQVRLISEESKRGYFIDSSLKKLFRLVSYGHKEKESGDKCDASFRVRHIDSPMFDDRKLHHLGNVKFRNEKWQQIICSLSLSKQAKGRGRGRISYANLGVNQLGSVYESLLAYRGFYAEEDYIEVHKENAPEEGTFLVPYSRLDDFKHDEVLHDDTGNIKILPKGTFVYRLNGRDRQKSASYYTPEVLTRSTVKYTLKAILDEIREGKRAASELLDLKILEPAMGAAAFQNEVINQIAEAYLQYRQEEKRQEFMNRTSSSEEDARDGSWRIQPDKYRDELQKVKAFIATHNVYGVDLNPTAIELGKLSLWLNVIHKDMTTPFFSNRLAVGNAVVGAWLKVYSKDEVYAIKSRRKGDVVLLPNPWWEKAPHKISFNKNSIRRLVNEVYHFLLPDQNMLGVRTISDYKEKAKAEKADCLNQTKPYSSALERMKAMIADWTRPINNDDFIKLQRLSSKIDILLKEYFQFQLSIENLTQNRMNLWGISGAPVLDVDSYEEKERLNDVRYRHDNAYFRLKMVMDYWCSLWFWNIEDVADLPNREQYWNDIEAMLNVSDDLLNRNTARAIRRNISVDEKGQLTLFADSQQLSLFDQPETSEQCTFANDELPATYNGQSTQIESEIIQLSKAEILTEVQGQATTLFDESKRFKIVDRLAKRYRFFHPMLEFIEVFWLRDGFDIICGNPPWLKLEFDEHGILSEKYPEVAIRKVSAPEARKMRDQMFAQLPATEELYRSEEIETTCSAIFMNAYCNYPLLVGQQTNLYKCVLENGFSLMSDKGFMGLLHPESVYDDPHGQSLRNEIYPRLLFHFQFVNTLKLFSEVLHWTIFGIQIYGCKKDYIRFDSISNLYHPSTIDTSYCHNGCGSCGGLKVEGQWNTIGHRDRIISYGEKELKVLSDTFEDGANWKVTKLVTIHQSSILSVLAKLSLFKSCLKDVQNIVFEGLNEAGAVDNGIISRTIVCPSIDDINMIYNGPHFYVANPLYKTPRKECKNKADYDTIVLNAISHNYIQLSNFSPCIDKSDYYNKFEGFQVGVDLDKSPLFDKWLDYYKVGYRRRLSQTGERTLTACILPPKTQHVDSVNSVIFKNTAHLIEFSGLLCSLPLDYFVKTIGAGDLRIGRLSTFPLGVVDKYKPAIFARTLLLNCLTTAYADLWHEMWNEQYKQETWSINDKRLKPFNQLHDDWSWDIPLRNYYERRMALVEIDVISAMALGLSLEDLEMIYNIQFPVLQQNENDTWYDQKGNIVFTCSKGLTGVGLDRPAWNAMRGEATTNENGETVGYQGTEPTYIHTIDPAKSELYGGQQVTYYAPYSKCDRTEDYRRAWAHFEKIFNN